LLEALLSLLGRRSALADFKDSEQRNQSAAVSQDDLPWRRAEERHYSWCKGHMALLESRLHTVLSSLALLDTWLERDESNTEDEVRVRRIKRWRREALVELEFVRQELEALEAKGSTENI
jgi:hypothetical protein